MRSLLRGGLRVRRRLHCGGSEATGASRQKRLMQGAGEAAGGVALQDRRFHSHADDPLQKGGASPGGGAEAARASGQSL